MLNKDDDDDDDIKLTFWKKIIDSKYFFLILVQNHPVANIGLYFIGTKNPHLSIKNTFENVRLTHLNMATTSQ